MGYTDVNRVGRTLPDGRVLLDSVSFRVGEGSKTALVGANGAGESALLRIVRGEQRPQGGAVTLDGELGVMPQFVGHVRDETTVHELLVPVSPSPVREAHADLEAAEAAMMVDEGERTQLRYAAAIARYGDAGGYDAEVVWDQCCAAALGAPYERCRWRGVRTLSGGERKRLVVEALLRGPAPVLLLDEPTDNLDVVSAEALESALEAYDGTILAVTHDRWFARGFDRFVVFGADGGVYEAPEPVWGEGRVRRER